MDAYWIETLILTLVIFAVQALVNTTLTVGTIAACFAVSMEQGLIVSARRYSSPAQQVYEPPRHSSSAAKAS